jgi:hypothetical protein
LGFCLLLQKKWLPGEPITDENMAQAMALEEDYWARQEVVTQNAIVKAWKG